MRISYNKLWKMLIDKNMKKSDLKEKAGISSGFPCEARQGRQYYNGCSSSYLRSNGLSD